MPIEHQEIAPKEDLSQRTSFTVYERLSLLLSPEIAASANIAQPVDDEIWRNAPCGLAERFRSKLAACSIRDVVDSWRGGASVEALTDRTGEQAATSLIQNLNGIDEEWVKKLKQHKLEEEDTLRYAYGMLCNQIKHLPASSLMTGEWLDFFSSRIGRKSQKKIKRISESTLETKAKFAEELRHMVSHSILCDVLARKRLSTKPENAIQMVDSCVKWAVSSDSEFVVYWRLTFVHAIFTNELIELEKHAVSLSRIREWFNGFSNRPTKFLLVERQRVLLTEAADEDIVKYLVERLRSNPRKRFATDREYGLLLSLIVGNNQVVPPSDPADINRLLLTHLDQVIQRA